MPGWSLVRSICFSWKFSPATSIVTGSSSRVLRFLVLKMRLRRGFGRCAGRKTFSRMVVNRSWSSGVDTSANVGTAPV